MLAISVELLHGTFRGDPDGTANTGARTRGEWPPAPSRLFAALVAADGTQENCRVTDGAELAWFEQLPPPVIHAHARPWHQPVEPRYVVKHEGSAAKKTHQEYVGRIPVLVRPGVRVAPRDACIVYSWQDASPALALVDALKRRAARIGYLGTSDSPVRVRVSTGEPQVVRSTDTFVPDDRGDEAIDVPGPGDLQLLDRMYDAWRQHGASVSRLQFPALGRTTRYRSPVSTLPRDLGTVTAWLRLPAAVSGRRVSALTMLFKEAVLSHYQRIHGEPPRVLHGHGFSAPGYELARYLALPDVGYRWSRGRIHGLALWLPPGVDERIRLMSRDAAFAIRRLTGRGIDVSVVPRDDEARPVAAHPEPLASSVSTLGDSGAGHPRTTARARLGGSRAVVSSRRSSGANLCPVCAYAARIRRPRPGAGRGKPCRPSTVALLPCGVAVCGAHSRPRRDRFGSTTWVWALRTGRRLRSIRYVDKRPVAARAAAGTHADVRRVL